MPAEDLAACRERCEVQECGGFVVFGGRAYLKAAAASELAGRRRRSDSCTLHLRLMVSPPQQDISAGDVVATPLEGTGKARSVEPFGGCRLRRDWRLLHSWDACRGQDAGQMPAGDLQECRRRCEAEGLGGFVVWEGTAYLKQRVAEELARHREESADCALHLGFELPALACAGVAVDDAYSADSGLTRESCCALLRAVSECCLAAPCRWMYFSLCFGLRSMPDWCVFGFFYDGPARWRAIERVMRRLSVFVPRNLTAMQKATDVAESLLGFRRAHLAVGEDAVEACDAPPELGHGEWLWPRGGPSPEDSLLVPEAQRKLVLYLHGGAFVLCNPATHRSLTTHLARAACAPVLVATYRRPPEDPHPAALEDVLQVYRQVICTFSPQRVVVAGESAGANLTVALCLRLQQLGLPLPCGLVLVSPWIDLSDFGLCSWRGDRDYLPTDLASDFARAYIGQASATDELISPVFSGCLGSLPPTLLTYGSVESIADQNRVFAERLRQAGVPVTEHVAEGMMHAYPIFADLAYGNLSRAVILVVAIVVGIVSSVIAYFADAAVEQPRSHLHAVLAGGVAALLVVLVASARRLGHRRPRDFLDDRGDMLRRRGKSNARYDSFTDEDDSPRRHFSSSSSDGSVASEGLGEQIPAAIEIFLLIKTFLEEVWGVPLETGRGDCKDLDAGGVVGACSAQREPR